MNGGRRSGAIEALPDSLLRALERQAFAPLTPALDPLVEALRQRFGSALQAVLFYGSCLRNADPLDGLVDLYAVVDDYTRAYDRVSLRVANRWLPPNVFYLELPYGSARLRAKYAVLALDDLRRGVSTQWFHSYVWARFAQPVAVAYVRDMAVRQEILEALANAVLTFLQRVVPRLPACFELAHAWQEGLRLTYSAELRVEPPDRTRLLVEAWSEYFEQVTVAALPALNHRVRAEPARSSVRFLAEIGDAARRLNRFAWVVRRIQGKVLSVLRLVKGLFTFDGGLDYIVWKLERHSGEQIEIPDRVRRRPLVHGWGMFWRLYRRGIFR